MKKTRNLFILMGSAEVLPIVMNEIQFKGITVVNNSLSAEATTEIFNNNKSIVCTNEIVGLDSSYNSPIYIEVINSTPPSLKDVIDLGIGNIAWQFELIANHYNCDIGDHKSNSSGLNGCPTAKDCCYCRILAKEETMNRGILYESENFFVMNTLGEFIKGYLLIIPKAHIMSMAELDSAVQSEFINVLDDVSYILKLTYHVDNLLVWENGTGNSGLGKAKDSIVHSHIHIAPSNLNVKKIQKISKFPMKEITLSDFPEYNKHSYLLIRGNNNNSWFINNNPDLYIPRQYIRQILAEEHLGVSNDEIWNWRTHPFYDLMEETDKDILNALKSNWNILPNRIKSNTEHLL